jgi:hypothetical protein
MARLDPEFACKIIPELKSHSQAGHEADCLHTECIGLVEWDPGYATVVAAEE